MGDLAWAFGWSARDLDEMGVDDIVQWHGQLHRIARETGRQR
jgi:hypothetical protein